MPVEQREDTQLPRAVGDDNVHFAYPQVVRIDPDGLSRASELRRQPDSVRRMAHLHADVNVRVNCLAPDWIATERAQRQLSGQPIPRSVSCDHVMKCIRNDSLTGTVTVIGPDHSAERR